MPGDTSDELSPVAELPRLATRQSGRGRAAMGRLSLVQPTPLIGRVEELATIRSRLTTDGARLLTLTGPAGVGKTRLALAAAALLADAFSDGVALVDLTPLQDPQLVPPTLAQALGVPVSSGESLMERIRAYQAERTVLVVLDNFEQVLPAASELVDLLRTCPGIVLLVTSRIPLRVRWEHLLRVSPLPVPDPAHLPPLAELAAIPSVALLLDRAHARQADFALTQAHAALVAKLVVRLDGLPLALELAAARLDVLPLSTIVRLLEDRVLSLKWEVQDLPARQRSLEAAIGWSYDLLAPHEQHLLRHLGVFTGRVTPRALASVADAVDEQLVENALLSLVEKGLVLRGQDADVDPEFAFGMLETVREYAREQLDQHGELVTAQLRHAHYFLKLAEQAAPHLRGQHQGAWFVRLERDHDNFRTALRWMGEHQDGSDAREGHLRLAAALSHFWAERGYTQEGWRWLNEALDRAPEVDPAVRSQALLGAGRFLRDQGQLDQAKAMLAEALTLAQQQQTTNDIAEASFQLAACAAFAGESAESTRLLHEALHLWQGAGDLFHVALVFSGLSVVAFTQGDYEAAWDFSTQALDGFQALGDVRTAALTRYHLALVAHELGDLPRTAALLQEALQAGVTLADRALVAHGAEGALWLAAEHIDIAQHLHLLGAADALKQTVGPAKGSWRLVGQSLLGLRERMAREGLDAQYAKGQHLSLEEVATLARRLLTESAKTMPPTDRTRAINQPKLPPKQTILLSRREQEVLQLVALGLSNKAIARKLIITSSTVNYHLASLFNKLEVDTRAQAVAVAAQRGLLSLH